MSAFTFTKLFEMASGVNDLYGPEPAKRFPVNIVAPNWQQILVLIDGSAEWGMTTHMEAAPRGQEMRIALFDADGDLIDTVIGYFTPFGGMPGGAIWYEIPTKEVASASVPDFALTVK